MSVEGLPPGARPGAADGARPEGWAEAGRGGRDGLRRDAGLAGNGPGLGGNPDARGRTAADLLCAEGRFAAALAGTSEPPEGETREQASADDPGGDGRPSEGDPRAPAFAVTVMPGDRPLAPALAALPMAADAARMEARIERVLAAVQAEIAAGAATGLRAGPGGAVTFTFPLPVHDLAIAGAVLTLEPGRLELALRGAGPLGEAQAAALRELAASLALRHPDRVVRVTREDSEGEEAGAGEAQAFSPFAPLRPV